MFARLGDAMDVVSGDDLSNAYASDPQLAQLHQIALLIVALRQEFNTVLNQIADASADVNPDYLAVLSQQISQYVDSFRALRATIDRTTVNANALNAVDQAILDIGAWAQQTAAFVARIPRAVLDTGTGALQAILDKRPHVMFDGLVSTFLAPSR